MDRSGDMADKIGTGELDEISTCRNFRQARKEGNREVTRQIPHYNLDMIISLFPQS